MLPRSFTPILLVSALTGFSSITAMADYGSYGYHQGHVLASIGMNVSADQFTVNGTWSEGGVNGNFSGKISNQYLSPKIDLGYELPMNGFTLSALGSFTAHAKDITMLDISEATAGTMLKLEGKLKKEFGFEVLVGKTFRKTNFYLGYRWIKTSLDFTARDATHTTTVTDHNFKGSGPLLGFSAPIMPNIRVKALMAYVNQGKKLTWVQEDTPSGNIDLKSLESQLSVEYLI